MSMSEFEKQPDELEPDLSCLDSLDGDFPTDFSADDITFARELESLFAIEREDVPPLYAQTLLASEDPRYQAVDREFELKTRALVFRRLNLKRRLFHSFRPSLRSLTRDLISASRPILVLGTACLLFMFSTMAAAGPSFAAGISELLVGKHGGVALVKEYPTRVISPTRAPQVAQAGKKPMTLQQAQQKLQFSLSLPRHIPERYTDHHFYLYEGSQLWADGPIMVLTYTYRVPGLAPRQITICQFKPLGTVKVLQVVQDGAAKKIRINPEGNDTAVYVEGYWNRSNSSAPLWIYNERSELIYEDSRTGTIFWIVGDKRDGIREDDLSAIAQSLYSLDANNTIGGRMDMVTQSEDRTPEIFANDVLYLDDSSDMNAPSFHLIGNPVETSHGNISLGD